MPRAIHLQWAVVFAQLLIGGTNHGIHGFLVPIRDKQVGCAGQQHRGQPWPLQALSSSLPRPLHPV